MSNKSKSETKSIAKNSTKHAAKKGIDRTALNAVERDLVEGLEGFLKDLKSDAPIDKKYTSRRVLLELVPHAYTPEQVKATRELLNASQSLFAQFLGVSVKAVRSWEQGKRPGDMASRFLDEIQHDPEYWRDRLKQAIRVRDASVN